jgi:hypothetical protein
MDALADAAASLLGDTSPGTPEIDEWLLATTNIDPNTSLEGNVPPANREVDAPATTSPTATQTEDAPALQEQEAPPDNPNLDAPAPLEGTFQMSNPDVDTPNTFVAEQGLPATVGKDTAASLVTELEGTFQPSNPDVDTPNTLVAEQGLPATVVKDTAASLVMELEGTFQPSNPDVDTPNTMVADQGLPATVVKDTAASLVMEAPPGKQNLDTAPSPRNEAPPGKSNKDTAASMKGNLPVTNKELAEEGFPAPPNRDAAASPGIEATAGKKDIDIDPSLGIESTPVTTNPTANQTVDVPTLQEKQANYESLWERVNLKKQKKDLNKDCPLDEAECHMYFDWLKIIHQDNLHQPIYHILPFIYVHKQVYPYPPLLPLAMSRQSNNPEWKNCPAFKFIFCPEGIDESHYKKLTVKPSFYKGGFMKKAGQFLKTRFSNDKE